MSQQATMTMANMGGPVTMNANTPNHAANADPTNHAKQLNTYIYDYFVRNQHYECARVMLNHADLPINLHKSSPPQRQTNGMDDMDMDKDVDRPKDLPFADLPPAGGHFLEDWWSQFWDIFNSRRSGNGKPTTIAYLTHQRQLQKARSGMTADPAAQRNFSMMNGQSADLKKMAMVNNGNMNPQMMAAAARQRAQMQAGQMERQGSQMDAHSGSPGSGGAPSPKRPRVDGNMQPQQQPRPGQPGQMPNQVGPTPNHPDSEAHARTRSLMIQHNINPDTVDPQLFNALAMQPTNHQHKSLENYNAQMQQTMTHALQKAQASSNNTKGMPQNNVAAQLQAGAQGSPMPQGPMDVMNLDPAMRQGMMPNNGMNGQGGANGNGSHALQDYQMQLMLLEQQNKRRLMMARGDQEVINNHTGVPAANGQFANMSPSGRGPSPNPDGMSRGTPKMSNGPSPNGIGGRGSPAPGFDPNVLNALQQQRAQQQLMMANGQMMPRSNPMNQAQMDMLRVAQASGGMLPNGPFAGNPGMPPNMMQGQPGPQPGQVQPNMTPRQGNMAPPPAPQQNAAGTQPSSPAPAAAPPTPSQSAKGKPGGKKDTKAGKGSNKKNANTTAATPASEAEQPPTPTPQTPMTNAKSFNQNQAAAMANGGLTNGQVNGAPGMQPGVMQPGQPDLAVPQFMDNPDQFMITDFAMEGAHGDVLDNFDFDAFLQNTGDDGGMPAFDYDFNGVAGVEGDPLGS